MSLTVQDEPQTSDSVCLSYTTRGQAMPCCAGHRLQYPCFVYGFESVLLYIGYAFSRTKEQNMHTILC